MIVICIHIYLYTHALASGDGKIYSGGGGRMLNKRFPRFILVGCLVESVNFDWKKILMWLWFCSSLGHYLYPLSNIFISQLKELSESSFYIREAIALTPLPGAADLCTFDWLIDWFDLIWFDFKFFRHGGHVNRGIDLQWAVLILTINKSKKLNTSIRSKN